ncbi:MAG: ComEC family competence protein [Cytophagia bacterium]|nr:ComEC family competence protein [Cytophagia bacterium]
MFKWVPYVFVRFTVVFTAGILLAIYLPDCIAENIALWSLSSSIFLYFLLYLINSFYGVKVNPGFTGLLIIFLSGYLLVLQKTETRNKQHLIHFTDSISHFQVVLISHAQDKPKSWKMEARLQKVKTDKQWIDLDGKVLLYFAKEHFPQNFQYGDVLLIEGSPQVLTPPANPGEFDYKRFLSFRNIYHQAFIRANKVYQVDYAPPSPLLAVAIQVRSWADRVLKQYVRGDQEQAIATALVLGITDGLDNDIMHAYSATGALHVLAVSGLHVSIIYGILLLLLKPLSKREGGQWMIAVVSLSVLWGYALITGLSPSVLRAVTMFSFVALARPLGWSTNIYNTLAASAFCLLLHDPYLIMSVGFQLSYAAVFGIVYLQRPIYLLWVAPGYWTDKVWQISTVSIAAQLATVSLGLLYFHQFPMYFLFSNLFVIPISFAVLVLGLAVLALCWLTPLALGLGWLLTLCIQAMNGSVVLVESLPFSLLDNLYINTAQSWLIMLLLGSLLLLFQNKQFIYLQVAFCFALLLTISTWYHYQHVVHKNEWIIYKVNGATAMDFISKGRSYFLADSALLYDDEKIRFHIRPNRLINEAKQVEAERIKESNKPLSGCRLLQFQGKRVLIIHEKISQLPPLQVDFVVISHNAITLKQLAEQINFEQVVLDSSNSFYFAERMLQESAVLNKKAFSVLHSGYFKIVI